LGVRARAPRATASGLVLALAVGVAGTTGISTALAVDSPSTVALSGSLRDAAGSPLPGIHLVVAEEQSADGALAGYEVATARDGSFRLDVQPWGTAATPARITIRTTPDATMQVLAARCSRTVGVSLAETRDLALGDPGLHPAVLDLVAATTVLGEVCGTLATARPDAVRPPAAVTPPPTEADATLEPASTDRHAAALIVGFATGLLATILFVLPRPRRRRD
jgi:hypothetical protein